jgi:zinc transport system ATP-binding protein
MMRSEPSPLTSASDTQIVLSAEHVSFGFGSEMVVDDVTLRIEKGEFVAVVGPNGAGKSTLIRLFLGLLRPRAGTVRVLGVPPDQLEERWRIGYVPQRPSLPPDMPATVQEVVAAGRLARTGWWRWLGPEDRRAVEHALQSVGLAELRKRRIGELSGGQQQRAFIAKALACEPDILVLDEPASGLDADSRGLFRDSLTHLIREHGAAVLLVSHELGAVARDLDRIVV